MKFKKIISVLSSFVITAACINSVVTAEGNPEYDADFYIVDIQEVSSEGKHNQWYTTNTKVFRPDGINVKVNGDYAITNFFRFVNEIRPSEIYDGKNFDYVVPVQMTCNDELLDINLPVKIGQEGDVNLDHIVDARDPSAITRDLTYYSNNKKSQLDDFGIYLGEPLQDGSAYGLTIRTASILASKLAKEAIGKADGNKYENKSESPYAVSISKANGLPGEKVTLQVVVEADDSFESLDAVIQWDDDSLKTAGAVSVNGTLCESYIEDGMISIVDYSEGGISDGAVVSLEFVIPEDAEPGTSMDVYFSNVETFAVYKNGESINEADIVNVAGATIGVLKPKETTATNTPTGTSTTTSTTVTAAPSGSSTTTTGDKVVVPVQQGDANLDGKVDVRDAAYIANKLAKNEGSLLHNLADYNRDGVKNVRDAAAIAKFLATNK